jgi:hypothetical protein
MIKLTFLITLILCGGWTGMAQDTPVPETLEPSAWTADFESGSVGAWSSYPPAQDTAYDPTIWIKRVEDNASRCLVKEIVPYSAIEYVFGVRKKLNLYVTKQSVMSFRFYVKNYAGTDNIIVKLGFADGGAEEIAVPVREDRKWQDAAVSFSPIIASPGPRLLSALAIMAVCPKADPETILRLAVDELKINGYREKKIRFRKPGVHELEELGVMVATEHFDQGGTLTIEGDFPLAVRNAEIELTRSWDKVPSAAVTMRRGSGNLWEASLRDLKPGLWRAHVTGTTAAGNRLSVILAFLVKPKSVPNEHPYLLFTPAGLPDIKSAIADGRTKNAWEQVKKAAAAFREKFNPAVFRYNLDAYDEIFWLPTYEGYVRALHTPSQFIRENAIVYALSGDREAGDASRRALLSIAAWPSFVHPHILNQGQFTYWPVGLALIDFAMGYDLVYDLLSPQERKEIAAALYNKGVTEVFKEYVRDNRVSSNTSNWISHVTGGGILCALAVRREFSDSELEPYLTGMIIKLGEFIQSTFDPSGYYGEGYYYHNFAMQSLSHSLPALDHNFAIPIPDEVKNSFQYILYQQDNETGRIYEFGDAHDDLIPSSMSNFAHVLHIQKNPYLLWLYRQRPGNNYLDVLFPAPPGQGAPPQSLPLTKRLREVGSVIFRSGFGHGDFVFLFKCGPFYNHQHFDQGSFFLADRGELFVQECGNSNYYEDPWYPRLYIQAGGHNCLLSDGAVESQKSGDFRHDVVAWQDFARMTDFLDWESGAFISADLTPVYKGAWKSLRRHILYLKPRTILLLDRAEGPAAINELSLRFHAPRKENIRLEGRTARIAQGSETLFIRTLDPERFEARIFKRPMSLNEFKAENSITMKARGFLELAARVEIGRSGFTHILSTDEEIISGLRAGGDENIMDRAIGGDHYFINKTDRMSIQAGSAETDALVFSRLPDGFIAARASSVKDNGRLLIKASHPASFTFRKKAQALVLSFSAPEGTRWEIFTGKRPKALKLNQQPHRKWEFHEGWVMISPPSGEGTIDISGLSGY